jgi:hypothetical protein
MGRSLTRLTPTIPLDTPRGAGDAWAVIDYGEEHHLLWCVFIRSTGESWQVRNDQVRLRGNESMRPKEGASDT